MLSLRTLTPLLPLLLGCCTSSVALAGPRQTVAYTNIDTVAPAGNAANQTRTITLNGAYPLKRIDFSGQLTTLVAGSQPIHAHIIVTPPPNTGITYSLPIIWNTTAPAVNAVTSGSYSFDVPANWPSAGTFTFEFSDDTDNGPGADARWKTINISMCDSVSPPAWPAFFGGYDDMGIISAGTRSKWVSLSPGAVHWVRFHTANPIAMSEFGYALSIDTLDSNLPPFNDTVIALYDGNGHRIALNDDISAPTNLFSALSFGTSAPSGSPITESRIGADGSLEAGTYYLAVVAFDSTNTYGDDFQVVSHSIREGSVRVNIRSTIPAPSGACPADFNRSGNTEVQDIFDFLSAWFAGCQ